MTRQLPPNVHIQRVLFSCVIGVDSSGATETQYTARIGEWMGKQNVSAISIPPSLSPRCSDTVRGGEGWESGMHAQEVCFGQKHSERLSHRHRHTETQSHSLIKHTHNVSCSHSVSLSHSHALSVCLSHTHPSLTRIN